MVSRPTGRRIGRVLVAALLLGVSPGWSLCNRCLRLGWGLSSGDTIPVRREPCQVLVFSGCNSHPATGSLQPVAIGAAVEVTKPSEPSRQTGRFGDSASRQAVIASER